MTEEESYRQMDESDLIAKKEAAIPNTHVYNMALKELLRRQKEKENQNQNEQREIKKDQRQIKILTAIILALTIAILGYTIAQFYK
jgi:hypothetical protein